ncbi:betaine aldehyde dehydrogenase [Patellaria atrata CBS 101060]|uniref:aldehyde dehydrogenase (NAD(+)) n=1 Tax=Patellaria atrata CBS 101060 TaxID=1346257 RepID=A0A9P4SJ04_9PEZI|nr:betaine aldehyde dehydrogenase [Patellaria atrata CBS 101060]
MTSLPYTPSSLYFGGQPQQPISRTTFKTIDPSTNSPLAVLTESSQSDIDRAISSAAEAFPKWAATPAAERARILQKAALIIRERNDELARVETHDTGKPFSETSTVDVVTGADVLEYFANLVGSGGLNGETSVLREDAWVYTKKEPLGVCVGIGAWNYPIQIALWKSAPCLTAGNTMIYKPSEVTPLHGQYLAEIYTQAGVPPGVFNIVQGGPSVGTYLTTHPTVAKVSFTGQVSTGKKVAGCAAGSMKYVTMELGGKSPLLVLDDADVETAVEGAMMANFFSTGQVCTNGTRVLIQKAMKPEFEELLLEKLQNVRVGSLMNPNTNFGPLVSETHYQKVRGYIKHGIEVDKAKLLYGGLEAPEFPSGTDEKLKQGFWVRPTIFTNCRDDMRIVKEEIFGPVMCILTYDTLEEAIRRANDTELGLAAGVFTKDLNKAHRMVAKLEAGITWINGWGESPAEMSVGGWKMSGVGVENGKRGIEAWVRNKSTLIDMSGKIATAFPKL